jgi:hypothetical protein
LTRWYDWPDSVAFANSIWSPIRSISFCRIEPIPLTRIAARSDATIVSEESTVIIISPVVDMMTVRSTGPWDNEVVCAPIVKPAQRVVIPSYRRNLTGQIVSIVIVIRGQTWLKNAAIPAG